MDNKTSTEEKTSTSEQEETKQEETKVEETTEETVEETTEESSQNIDHKAEIQKIKKQLGQAEHTIEKLKEDKKETKDNTDVSGVTEDKLREMLQESNSNLKRDLNQAQFESELDSISSNEDEKEHISLIYKHRIVPTGNVREDLENAKIIANKARIIQTNEELLRSLSSKGNKGDGSTAGQKTQNKVAPQLTPEEQKLAKSFGLTAEQIVKAKQKE